MKFIDLIVCYFHEQGERKKQLARTRSGRLSRPPRHMVKDYKRLHHLDFADADLDDSDGGYSDYQMSEHEAEDPPEKTDSKELLPGLYQWQSTCLEIQIAG